MNAAEHLRLHPARLAGVCNSADFNQLVREGKTRYADESRGRPMVAHILLIQTDARFEMFLGVAQKYLQLGDVRPCDTKSRQHTVEVFQCLPGLSATIRMNTQSKRTLLQKGF